MYQKMCKFVIVLDFQCKVIIFLLSCMKISLIVTGKTDSKWLHEGIEVYCKRLKFYTPFEIKVIPDLKNTKSLPVGQQKILEGRQMLQALADKEDIFLLDEGGKTFSSVEFSQFMEKKMMSSCRELVFVVGGPWGFSPEVKNRAKGEISLSKMTFSHQMVRLLFVEQLYRAFTIIKGEPYHNE